MSQILSGFVRSSVNQDTWKTRYQVTTLLMSFSLFKLVQEVVQLPGSGGEELICVKQLEESS